MEGASGLHPLACEIHSPTYTDNVHEAIHSIADLEEQVLALPFGGRTEGRPDEPRDTGDEEEGTQDGCCYLNLLNDCQRDGLPLQGEEGMGGRGNNIQGQREREGGGKDRRLDLW